MLTQALLLALLAIGSSSDGHQDTHVLDGQAIVVVEGEVDEVLVLRTSTHNVGRSFDVDTEQVYLDVVFERFVEHDGRVFTGRARLECFRQPGTGLGLCEGLERGDRVRVWGELDVVGQWFWPSALSSPPKVVLIERQ